MQTVLSMYASRRILKVVGGFALLGLGAILLFLPGPGALTIMLGLALLAAEFVWADRLLGRVKRQTHRVRALLTRKA